MKNKTKNVQASRLGHEEQYQLGYQTVELMVTDMSMFSRFGVGQKEIDELKQLLTIFGNRRFDEELLAFQKMTTRQKMQLIDEMMSMLYNLDIKLDMIFPNDSPLYDALGLSNIRTLSENEIVKKAKLTVNMYSGTYSALLAPHISEQEIADLQLKADTYSNLNALQEKAEIERHIATQIRASQALELYNYVAKIRKMGKKMWALTDVVRSNAYLMPKYRKNSSQEGDLVTEFDENDNES
jgi:hypothetical protein